MLFASKSHADFLHTTSGCPGFSSRFAVNPVELLQTKLVSSWIFLQAQVGSVASLNVCSFPSRPWGANRGSSWGREVTAKHRGGTGSAVTEAVLHGTGNLFTLEKPKDLVIRQGSLQRAQGTRRSCHGQELGRTPKQDHVQPEESVEAAALPSGPVPRADGTEPQQGLGSEQGGTH